MVNSEINHSPFLERKNKYYKINFSRTVKYIENFNMFENRILIRLYLLNGKL